MPTPNSYFLAVRQSPALRPRNIERLMAGAALDQYLYLLDEAFEGGRWHSLLGNLDDIPAADWEWIPSAGSRSVRAIAQHVGECKRMYENHALARGNSPGTISRPTSPRRGLGRSSSYERVRSDCVRASRPWVKTPSWWPPQDELGRDEGNAMDHRSGD